MSEEKESLFPKDELKKYVYGPVIPDSLGRLKVDADHPMVSGEDWNIIVPAREMAPIYTLPGPPAFRGCRAFHAILTEGEEREIRFVISNGEIEIPIAMWLMEGREIDGTIRQNLSVSSLDKDFKFFRAWQPELGEKREDK